MPTLPRARTALLALLLLSAGAATAATPFHFGLARSVPEDQATVEHASDVTLWFTEPPSEGTVSIRLVDGGGALVPAGDVVQDDADPKAFSISTEKPLATGGYTVSWRGMGDDGHVVRGTLTFTVSGH